MFHPRNKFIYLLTFIFQITLIVQDSAGFWVTDPFYQASNRTRRQASCAGTGLFQCASGDECIDHYKQCDGVNDCRDASDETTKCRQYNCPKFAFRCSYGACVDGDAECNGSQECADNSDENTARCPATPTVAQICGPNKYTCKNKQCIDSYAKCDGALDCTDGSDETTETCSKTHCPNFAYQCRYGGCVDGDAKCDGNIDCVDSSDEDPILCNTVAPSGSTASPPTVPAGDCYLPPQPLNGKYSITGNVNLQPGTIVNTGTFLMFACNSGYKLYLESSAIVICVNKMWSATFPICIKTCPARVSESVELTCQYDGKQADCTKPVYDGTIAEMKCKTYYEANDLTYNSNLIKCSDGTWDNNILRCTPVCGNLIPKGGQLFLVGASSAIKGNFPWHVGVYRKKNTGAIEHICGGSIVNTKLIISAAHCFTDEIQGKKEPASNYLVAAGKYYRDYEDARDEYAQKSDVQTIVIPPDYRGRQSSFTNDLALLVLKQGVSLSHLIQPVCIDWQVRFEQEQLQQNNHGTVVGWGFTTEDAKIGSEELKQLSVPYVDKDTCFKIAPPDYLPFITPDKFCAGYTNGSSVCRGDSGGGLVFYKSDTKKYFIRGLVSNGPIKDNSCDSRQVGAYTQISKYMDLIRQIELEYRPK